MVSTSTLFFLFITLVILFILVHAFCRRQNHGLIKDNFYCNYINIIGIPDHRLALAQQHQHAPVYNISGTVQNQDRTTHYPPDAFLSVNHIQTHFQNTSETNKPSTFSDAPPSYEEAIKMVQSTTTTTTTTSTTTVIPGVHRPPPPQTE